MSIETFSIPSTDKDPKDLARERFARSYRLQDHGSNQAEHGRRKRDTQVRDELERSNYRAEMRTYHWTGLDAKTPVRKAPKGKPETTLTDEELLGLTPSQLEKEADRILSEEDTVNNDILQANETEAQELVDEKAEKSTMHNVR